MLNYIHWAPQETILGMRWYSLLWVVGLLAAYLVVKKLYKDQKIDDKLFEPLFIYCFVGILVGARLGHCLFYEPDYYLASGKHIIEMFIPFKYMADGNWHFTGYAGLASHGGTIGLTIALFLYVRKTKLSIKTVLDSIAIATPITACCIRLGNLMNSEIVGKPTDVAWAFVFENMPDKAEAMIPRHPGQLYEAMAYALLFVIGWIIYRRRQQYMGTLFFFGLCLTYIFTFRFFIEYTKDIQVAFEEGMLFNMGQLLSVPFIIVGAVCMYRGWKQAKPTIA